MDTQRRHARPRSAERGGAIVEIAVLLPLLFAFAICLTDIGRLVYSAQACEDATRTAAQLAARGIDPLQAIEVIRGRARGLDIEQAGAIIVTIVEARSTSDTTPWVVRQVRVGAHDSLTSRIGEQDAPAKIPGLTSIVPGRRIAAVEIAMPFQPLFRLGSAVYPETIYDATFF